MDIPGNPAATVDPWPPPGIPEPEAMETHLGQCELGQEPKGTAEQLKNLLKETFKSTPKEELKDALLQVLGELFSFETKQQPKKAKAKKNAKNKKAQEHGPNVNPTAILKPTPAGDKMEEDQGTMVRQPIPAAPPVASLTVTASAKDALLREDEPIAEETQDDDGEAPFTPVSNKRGTKRACSNLASHRNRPTARHPPKRYTITIRPRTKRSLATLPKGTVFAALAVILGNKVHEISYKILKENNTISVRTAMEASVHLLLDMKDISVHNGPPIPVQAYQALGVNQIRGVMYEADVGENSESVKSKLVSDTHTIVSARLMGNNSTTVLITFQGNKLPRNVRYSHCIMPIYAYVPKTVTCNNCHITGHKSDICPGETVCGTCGRHHEETQDDRGNNNTCPEPTPFCQTCKKTGHLATGKDCPKRAVINKKLREKAKNRAKPKLTSLKKTPPPPPKARDVAWSQPQAPSGAQSQPSQISVVNEKFDVEARLTKVEMQLALLTRQLTTIIQRWG